MDARFRLEYEHHVKTESFSEATSVVSRLVPSLSRFVWVIFKNESNESFKSSLMGSSESGGLITQRYLLSAPNKSRDAFSQNFVRVNTLFGASFMKQGTENLENFR